MAQIQGPLPPLLLYLLVALFGNGVCVEVTVPQDPVMQQRGLSVKLPCHYKTSIEKNFVIEWTFAPGLMPPDHGKQILYYTSNMLYKAGSQEKRLSLLQNPPTQGDASIQLDDVHASDAGTYICQVNNPPDLDGSGRGSVHFTVLMPPSTPVCKGPPSASVGSDISLTCNTSEGVPAPIYSWTRLDSKTPVPVSNMVQNERTGKLLLTNISLAFSGTYQCVASNEYGQQSCQLSVLVTATAQAGAIAGAVIGVLLALLLLGAIVIFVVRYRKKKETRKAPSVYSGNELREDATAPGMSEAALQERDNRPESELSDRLSSRPESASTTKSQLTNFLV